MLQIVLLLSTIGYIKSSGIASAPFPLVASVSPVGPIAQVANAPVVTAASSQYFERTFNRLVVPPVVAPLTPVVAPPVSTVFPIAPAPTVFVEPTKPMTVAVNPHIPPSPSPLEPVQPNVAIAVATAQVAAPVATILLPPYPFGFPPNFGFIPAEQPINIPDKNTKEPTTQKTTQEVAVTTTAPVTTPPIDASSSNNNFEQTLPSNENINFNLYGPPAQDLMPQIQPLPQSQKPNRQFQPQLNTQFQPNQPNRPFQPRTPNSYLRPQQPNSLFHPQHTNLRYQPQQQNPQFKSQQPNPQFQLQQPNTQLQLQRPNSQIETLQPEFPPYPPHQQRQTQGLRPQLQQSSQYLPKQRPQEKGRPQKLKTSVEVVPVPLAYITPPPLYSHKTHAHVKVLKHFYSFVPPTSSRIILKPVKIRPVRLVKHKVGVRLQNLRGDDRDIEITTLNPFRRPNTKPPRI